MTTIYSAISNARNNTELKSYEEELHLEDLAISLYELKKQVESDLSDVYKIKW